MKYILLLICALVLMQLVHSQNTFLPSIAMFSKPFYPLQDFTRSTNDSNRNIRFEKHSPGSGLLKEGRKIRRRGVVIFVGGCALAALGILSGINLIKEDNPPITGSIGIFLFGIGMIVYALKMIQSGNSKVKESRKK
ncbi:hypothetical protein [Pollutibacter soli]|uniref:hypothetical protein n=1 Tax=Pollutibacter soli TaxID=3034157 RepID=UPI003013629B